LAQEELQSPLHQLKFFWLLEVHQELCLETVARLEVGPEVILNIRLYQYLLALLTVLLLAAEGQERLGLLHTHQIMARIVPLVHC
jgi:hypothetical protein